MKKAAVFSVIAVLVIAAVVLGILHFTNNSDKTVDENLTESKEYGYVAANSVNVRQAPASQAERITSLGKYAYFEVISSVTEENTETVWYEVLYGDLHGYMNGNYVKILSKEENEAFLNSIEYQEGIVNNSK